LNKPTAVPHLQIKEIDQQVLVHDARSDMIHVLNPTAGYILRLADGTRETEEIARLFAENSAIDIDQANQDVQSIIAEFQRLEIISEASP